MTTDGLTDGLRHQVPEQDNSHVALMAMDYH